MKFIKITSTCVLFSLCLTYRDCTALFITCIGNIMLKLLVLERINGVLRVHYFASQISIPINIILTRLGTDRILVSTVGSFYMYIKPRKLQIKSTKSIFLGYSVSLPAILEEKKKKRNKKRFQFDCIVRYKITLIPNDIILTTKISLIN